MPMAKAVAYRRSGPLDGVGALVDVEIHIPRPAGHDLLVEVRAVSVNPVDVKLRAGSDPGGQPRVLGFDAAGVVVGVGAQVDGFAVGDEVFYAGSVARAGSYASHQVVDERIVGRKPVSLGFAAAAAVPLTGITAWEALFERLRVDAGTLLVVAGAGGVDGDPAGPAADRDDRRRDRLATGVGGVVPADGRPPGGASADTARRGGGVDRGRGDHAVLGRQRRGVRDRVEAAWGGGGDR